MQIESMDIEEITTALPTDWTVRLVIRGSGLEERALPLVGELGPQKIQGLMPGGDEGVVLGFLIAQPSAGDELRLGYADQPLQSTGITFQPPIA
jgi:hypothetical protein